MSLRNTLYIAIIIVIFKSKTGSVFLHSLEMQKNGVLSRQNSLFRWDCHFYWIQKIYYLFMQHLHPTLLYSNKAWFNNDLPINSGSFYKLAWNETSVDTNNRTDRKRKRFPKLTLSCFPVSGTCKLSIQMTKFSFM